MEMNNMYINMGVNNGIENEQKKNLRLLVSELKQYMVRMFVFICYVQVSRVGYSITLGWLGKWLEEEVLGSFVYVCLILTMEFS